MNRKVFEAFLKDFNINRYKVIERRRGVELFVLNSKMANAIQFHSNFLRAGAPFKVDIKKLPWYQCFFKRKQWISEL